jgi:hypothetical protein
MAAETIDKSLPRQTSAHRFHSFTHCRKSNAPVPVVSFARDSDRLNSTEELYQIEIWIVKATQS